MNKNDFVPVIGFCLSSLKKCTTEVNSYETNNIK